MESSKIGRRRIFAHVPYRYLKDNLDLLLAKRLQPEIYFSSTDLKRAGGRELEELALILRRGGLDCTFHGPFMDLNPGAVDQDVRLLSLSKYRALIELAYYFQPKTIVFHPGYDRWRYDGQVKKWLKESLKTWREVLSAAGRLVPGTKILLENIFETEPLSLLMILKHLNDRQAGFCFDTGHFMLFDEVGLDDWLDKLGDYLVEIHLHDNDGGRDDHLPPGQGSFPFEELFESVGSKLKDLYLVVEAHSRQDLFHSLDYINKRFGLVGEPQTEPS